MPCHHRCLPPRVAKKAPVTAPGNAPMTTPVSSAARIGPARGITRKSTRNTRIAMMTKGMIVIMSVTGNANTTKSGTGTIKNGSVNGTGTGTMMMKKNGNANRNGLRIEKTFGNARLKAKKIPVFAGHGSGDGINKL